MSTALATALPLRQPAVVQPIPQNSVSNKNLGAGTQRNFQQIGGSNNTQFNAETINYHERTKAPPPPTSTVPFPRDPDFVDRAELKQIEEKLSAGGTRAALIGLGGVGKSQIAIEYCYRVREDSPDTWVLWIHASSATRFDEDIRKLASDVGILGSDGHLADVFRLVYKWLRDSRNGKWLLVLDNADDADWLHKAPDVQKRKEDGRTSGVDRVRMDHLPICEHGLILITSRSRRAVLGLVDDGNVIKVKPMDEGLALALLDRKLGEHSNTTKSQKLAIALEYMPLALAQAAAYINAVWPMCSVEQYLDKLQESDKSMMTLLKAATPERRRDYDAKNSIVVSWQISFEYIRAVRPSAAGLLSLMSFYNHQGIPAVLLTTNGSARNLGLQKRIMSIFTKRTRKRAESLTTNDFVKDVTILQDFSFVTSTLPLVFEMHRLVQIATRMWLDSHGSYQEWASKSIENLDKAAPTGEHANWEQWQHLYPHARSALDIKLDDSDAVLQLASVLFKAAWFDLRRGSASNAEELAAQSLSVRTRLLGVQDRTTLSSKSMLAVALQGQGRYGQAEEMNRRALEGREKALGKEHPDTLISVWCLADLMERLDRKEDALELYNRATTGFLATLGSEHPRTAKCQRALTRLTRNLSAS